MESRIRPPPSNSEFPFSDQIDSDCCYEFNIICGESPRPISSPFHKPKTSGGLSNLGAPVQKMWGGLVITEVC